MTPQQARSFKSFSEKNAAFLKSVCGKCQPYKDWFTFVRWQAQGKTVSRGQHGTRLSVIVEKEIKLENGKVKKETFLRVVPVFCRHQVN